jgi:PKD repeat protein
MKLTMKTKIFTRAIMLLGIFALAIFHSCKPEEVVPDPIASFQFEQNEDNWKQIDFTNFSQNAETYSWAFGDGETSTEESPSHIYPDAGKFNVVLTATNSAGVSKTFEQEIEVTDPYAALRKLAGETTKTWRLHRVGTTLGVGPSAEDPFSWWNLENDGKRPCVYYHEFTFGIDGSFVFDDKGMFWGEVAVFSGTAVNEICFEATAANMVNKDGANVSAWLGGSHTFEYEPSTGMVTLTGMGAWMGLPQLTTTGEDIAPVASKSFKITIEENEGYDLMTVLYAYDWGVWMFKYASYSNPALEPDVVTEAAPWGEDLPDITPTEMFIKFSSREAADMAVIDTVTSGSSVEFGVDDPADATAAKVGKFTRTAGVQWQELQMRTSPDLKDIQFDNFSTAKIDIFIPANTTFAEGGLVKTFVFGFADQSQTQEWWNSPVQFAKSGDDVVVGAWTTYTFDLTDVKARQDIDMIYLGIGGGGHEAEGIFYVRNLIFE